MESLRFNYQNSTIGYTRFGTGPRLVLCFHGYGENARMFEFLEKHAGNEFTFYAPDLPFHGNTVWNHRRGFDQNDLVQIIKGIIAQHTDFSEAKAGKPETRHSKFYLLGFSLGGRISLSLYQAIPYDIERIILLAPDGLKVNFWYWFSTQTLAGNKLFAFTMKHPGWFFGFLNAMNKLKLVNASVFKFVKFYVDNKDARQSLYDRWTSLRKLRPDLPRIKKLVKERHTKVRLIYGRHDRIILSSVGEKFRKGIEEYCTLTVIESGHQILHDKHAEEIMKALNF